MKQVINIIIAEIKKQHRNTFHSYLLYISLAVWPIVHFFQAYYAYKPFESMLTKIGFFNSNTELLLFLIIGFWGWLSFWSLVQSAALEMYTERENGTLEIIFISPTSRLLIIYGRALGSLIENIWLFTVFSIIIFIIFLNNFSISFLWRLPLVLLIMFFAGLVWGGLINVIFLISRDAGVFYTITTEPMLLFSGVKIPISFFPFWARIIGSVFPLTYTLGIARYLLFGMDAGQPILIHILIFIGALIILFFLTLLFLKLIERRQLSNGTLFFF